MGTKKDGKKTEGKGKYRVVFFLSAILFTISIIMLTTNHYKEAIASADLAELAEQRDKFICENQDLSATYGLMHERNEDMAGWISIENTVLDYPVMHTKEDEEFYLRRDFEKKYSVYGLPFIESKCDRKLTCDNVIIYGHYVKNGNMFGSLEAYKEESYLKEHPTINLDTLEETRHYEVFAVFVTTDDEEGFRYFDFIDADRKEAYDEFVQKVKELSLYHTGITPEYGQQLLTLSTCDYSKENGRLVIIARRVGDEGGKVL